MKLQVVLPNESAEMEPERPAQIATAAEKLGFHTAWLPDHLLPPEEYGETYGGVYEPLVTLAHIAGTTSTIRLGTSVLVLPLREPFLVAKQVATLDRLSGGRVTLGVGIGWDRTEFDAVGADFHTRGRRTDETTALLRELFRTGRGPGGDGVFEPRPVGSVPVMVGGLSEFALRRTAKLADEWQGVNLNPTEFGEYAVRLREMADRPIRVGTRINWTPDRTDLAEAAAEARAFADAGADSLAVWFGPHEDYEARMTAYAEAVIRAS